MNPSTSTSGGKHRAQPHVDTQRITTGTVPGALALAMVVAYVALLGALIAVTVA